MNVHFSYKISKTSDLEQTINQQVEKLRKRLQFYRPELVHLHGRIEQLPARQGILVQLNLRLPSGQMAAEHTAKEAIAAIKSTFADLLEQYLKHRDHLRAHHKWPNRRRVPATGPEPQVPFEETFAAVKPETVSNEDISSYVNANLPRLQRYIERELRFRENSGNLRPDEVSPAEVLDEAISNALGNGQEKPEKLALEPWLYRLALRAIDRIARDSRPDESNVRLESPAWPQEVRGSDEPQLQYHQPDEILTRENTIRDERVATPEEVVASEEVVGMIDMALRGAKPEDRETFVLYTLEGFTVPEISHITDRKPEQVRASIAAAREHLRKTLPVNDRLTNTILEHSKTA